MPTPRFLTLDDVAETLNVSWSQAYALVRSGELPAIRFGRSFRVPESAVAAAMSAHVVDVSRSA